MRKTKPLPASHIPPYLRRRIAYLLRYRPSSTTARQVAYAVALWRVHRLREHPAIRVVLDDLCAVCDALAALYALPENPLTSGRPSRNRERADLWRVDFAALSDRHRLVVARLTGARWDRRARCGHDIDASRPDGTCEDCDLAVLSPVLR